ncbi:glutathione hydrolase 1 proenzyme-like [Amphiura filiformis]|uniref:glutathione hydrolase 1 proenzyme-like n=1 Tax=Amphiura filiformis TaxID=82378 RepID=UPI003B21B47C
MRIMSLLDEEIPLNEDADQSWTFKQQVNLVELEEFGDDAALIGTSFNHNDLVEASLKQNGLDSSSIARRRDEWEEDSGGSLSSNEWGPLVADELDFEPFRGRIKPVSRCRLVTIAVLTLFIVTSIAVGVVLGLQAAELASHSGTGSNGADNVHLYQHAAVATDAGPCSEIGRDMLKKGGSAIDAAIASLVCIGLYNPQSSGIGGGHFLMYYDRDTQMVDMIDARESAPLSANRDMYNNESVSSIKGGLAIAVPGEVAGYWKAHQLYGKLKWSTLFEPTIRLARTGFHVPPSLPVAVAARIDDIRENPLLSQLFLREDGSPIQEGDIIYMKKFGDTLEKIAIGGADAFYKEELAEDIVNDIQENGGIITLQDLKQYEVKTRDPISVQLNDGLQVHTAPPPSSGAVLLLILNIIDGFYFNNSSFSSTNAKTQSLHKIVEAFKFAYAKRAYLGDEDYVDVLQLVSNMTSQDFANVLRSKISNNITYNAQYYGILHSTTEDHGTSQTCILDQYGNAVSVTGTVNLYFGSKVIGNRTGIIFNDEMDDFSKPGAANFFGFPPSESNFIVPGKRPMSSMSPTIIVNKEGDVQLVVGASGGSRIPSSIALVIAKHLWGGISITESIRQKRVHHQWIPNLIQYETGFNQDVLAGLRVKGHNMTERSYISIVQGISRNSEGAIEAYSDERKGGYPAGF